MNRKGNPVHRIGPIRPPSPAFDSLDLSKVPCRTDFMRIDNLERQSGSTSNILILGPAYQKSGYEVIRALKRSLDRTECSPGQQLEQRQFGSLLGVSKSTIHDWFHGALADPIQNLLCAFERLSETDRILFLREFCRECPRLEHPRLAHDVESLNRLRFCLEQRAGLTIVDGPAEPRTFLVTALGHSFARVDPQRMACGLDVHRPETFVPVAGVYYCQHPPNPAEARKLLVEIMDGFKDSKAGVVIFNGIWSGISQFPAVIRRLMTTRHVIVADCFGHDFSGISRIGLKPVQVLSVSLIPGKQALIHAQFE
jgi:hypothetical protein